MKRQELVGMLSLLLTALIWGFAFVAQVQGMDSMSPMFFNAARFTLGALSLVPILLWMRGRGSADKGDTAGADVVGTEASVAVSTDAASNGASDVVTITGAKLNANKPDSAVARLLANPVVISVICGIVLFTASTLQQYGILYGKSAGRAGFLTAMYIVMVPLLAFVFLRRRIGMVFQKPNPFPMSIYDNIAYGPRTHGIKNKARLDDIVERSLRGAAIWDEVKDRLKKNALGLSGGQQQRLCIARALAVEPEVLLMDEPTSALDPISTSKIEELAMQLREKYTIVIVTHNMQQAVRISDNTAFFLLGELIEYGNTEQIFSQPGNKKTEDYITGRFG